MDREEWESDGNSSGEDSFDEQGAPTYQEWKAFVVKTYFNGKDPVRKIINVPKNGSSPAKNGKRQPVPSPPPPPTPPPSLPSSISHHRSSSSSSSVPLPARSSSISSFSSPSEQHHQRQQQQQQQQVSRSQSQAQSINPLKRHFQPNGYDESNIKAKEAKKANLTQSHRPTSKSYRSTITSDAHRFKVPDRDSAGNPIEIQTVSNPYVHTKHPTSNSSSTSIKNQHFTSVTSSMNKMPSGQIASHNNNNKHHLLSASSLSQSSSSSSKASKSSHSIENKMIPIGKHQPQAHLKSRGEVFWSLNSSAKLLHVKSQLDEHSKIYVDKLVKNNGLAQREIIKLRKDKQELLNALKTSAKILSDAASTQSDL